MTPEIDTFVTIVGLTTLTLMGCGPIFGVVVTALEFIRGGNK